MGRAQRDERRGEVRKGEESPEVNGKRTGRGQWVREMQRAMLSERVRKRPLCSTASNTDNYGRPFGAIDEMEYSRSESLRNNVVE